MLAQDSEFDAFKVDSSSRAEALRNLSLKSDSNLGVSNRSESVRVCIVIDPLGYKICKPRACVAITQIGAVERISSIRCQGLQSDV